MPNRQPMYKKEEFLDLNKKGNKIENI